MNILQSIRSRAALWVAVALTACSTPVDLGSNLEGGATGTTSAGGVTSTTGASSSTVTTTGTGTIGSSATTGTTTVSGSTSGSVGGTTAATSDGGLSCNAYPNLGAPVAATSVPGAAPAMTGGTIADGTYVETSFVAYSGSSTSNTPVKTTIVITGKTMQFVFAMGGGSDSHRTYDMAPSGNRINLTFTCTDVLNTPIPDTYTATPTSIVFGADPGNGSLANTLQTFTRVSETADGGVACNTYPNLGALVTATPNPGAAPTMTGGTIADGTYVETSFAAYAGSSTNSSAIKTTMVITGNTVELVFAFAGNPDSHRTYHMAPSGNRINLTTLCADVLDTPNPDTYTATPASIVFGADPGNTLLANTLQTFTRVSGSGCNASNTVKAPASGLIADFTAGDAGVASTPLLAFPPGGPTAPTYTTTGGVLHITWNAPATSMQQFFGVILGIGPPPSDQTGPDCVDASAFTGVEFTISGSVSGCVMQYVTNDIQHVYSDGTPSSSPNGTGPMGAYSPSTTITAAQLTATPQTLKMPFTGGSGGNPTTPIDKSKLWTLVWQLTANAAPPGDAGAPPCLGDITIDDVGFY